MEHLLNNCYRTDCARCQGSKEEEEMIFPWKTYKSIPSVHNHLGGTLEGDLFKGLRRQIQLTKDMKMGEFPGGPVVKTWAFTAVGPGSIPGRGTKIPHAVLHSPTPPKKERHEDGLENRKKLSIRALSDSSIYILALSSFYTSFRPLLRNLLLCMKMWEVWSIRIVDCILVVNTNRA